MPRKTTKSQEKAPAFQNTQRYYLPTEAPWGGFINLRLDDESGALFATWLASADGKNYASFVDDMLGEGIKVTLAFDQEHSCYICSASGALCTETPKHRYSSSSRAGTIAEALAMTAYKHFKIVNLDYSDYRPSKTANGMNWG